MFPLQSHEVRVVPLLKKNIFGVISAVVDMIESSIGKRWDIRGHGVFYRPNLRPDRSHPDMSRP